MRTYRIMFSIFIIILSGPHDDPRPQSRTRLQHPRDRIPGRGRSPDPARTSVEADSQLAGRNLADADLPKDCLVLAFISKGHVTVPTGGDRPQVGDDVLVIGTPQAIDEVERRASRHSRQLGLVVVAGGGATGHAVVSNLEGRVKQLKLIELDRARAEATAPASPKAPRFLPG